MIISVLSRQIIKVSFKSLEKEISCSVGSNVPITARSVFNKISLFFTVNFNCFSISGYAKQYCISPIISFKEEIFWVASAVKSFSLDTHFSKERRMSRCGIVSCYTKLTQKREQHIRSLGWLDPLDFLAKYRNQTPAPSV